MYSVRSEGPIVLRARLTPANPTLVQGRLEFRLFNGNELLSTVISGDEVINPPFRTAKYILPAPDNVGYAQQLDVRVDFVTPQKRYRFDAIPIIIPRYRERDFVIGSVSPPNKTPAADLDSLIQSLKFENFTPVDTENTPVDRTVHTLISNFPAEQLPADPTSFTAFNMLVLAGEGFSTIRDSQWRPLLDWVEGGGSLCLMPRDNLSAEHISLLNRLVRGKDEKDTFLLGPTGELVLKEPESNKKQFLLRRGLGRIAIVQAAAETTVDPNSKEWRAVACHLWNVRNDQRPTVLAQGKWEERILVEQDQVARSTRQQYDYFRGPGQRERLGSIPINSGDRLIQSIMPSDLRIIPLSLIAFILFLYVLAIGPGDYFILGRLKMRKWTWVTFPVTTVLFAGGALWMAEWYMNTGDARRSVYFVDVGIEGKPQRVSQFEMLFNSRQRVVETPLKASLFTALNHQEYGGNSFQQFYRQNGVTNTAGASKPELTGRIPGNFTARQLTPKWVPQLNRITSILATTNTNVKSSDGTEASKPGDTEPEISEPEKPWLNPQFDWKQFERHDTPDWKTLIVDPDWRKSLVDPIRAQFSAQDLAICVCAGGQYQQLYGSNPLFLPTSPGSYAGQQRVVIGGQLVDIESNFMRDVTMLQDGGLFGIVSKIAPHGGRVLEDLTLVDPSDPHQWVLIVGMSEGGNWVVYRKLYAGIE